MTEEEPWLVVQVGGRPWGMQEIRKDIQTNQHRRLDFPDELFDRGSWFEWEEQSRSIPLFVRTSEQLGFAERQSRVSEVAEKLDQEGFQLCPQETAFQIMRQYPLGAQRKVGENFTLVLTSPLNFSHLAREGDPGRVSDATLPYLSLLRVSFELGDVMTLRRELIQKQGATALVEQTFPPHTRWIVTR